MDQLDLKNAVLVGHSGRRSDELYRPPQNETCGQGGTHLGNPPVPTRRLSLSQFVKSLVPSGFRM